eukprot:TRINITY_DN7214_c0_g1_i1.p1 TRINITY_DN7214_c0_g1~~TRINITY_DN7214_c0_g1_i1.p1  ORF type:complete len:998 (+),score=147.46 TRINITY_DN7214_c0_g1_i1:295-2994(+)
MNQEEFVLFVFNKINSMVKIQTEDNSKSSDLGVEDFESDAEWIVLGNAADGKKSKSSIDKSSSQTNKSDEFYSFNLPKEKLIAKYSCTIWSSKIPKSVNAYISMNYLCFYSSLMSQPIIIALNEIINIYKEDIPGLPGVIKIQTLSEEDEYTVVMFFKRNEMYAILEQLWTRAMENIEKSAIFIKMETEQQLLSPSKMNKNPNNENNTINETSLQAIKEQVDLISKEELQDTKNNISFCQMFNLPRTEIIFGEFQCSLVITSIDEQDVSKSPESTTASPKSRKLKKLNGTLYLSNSFMSFNSDYSETHESFLQATIPYSEIKKVKKTVSELNEEYSEFGELGVLPNELKAFTATHCYTLDVINRNAAYKILVDRCTDFRKVISDKCKMPDSLKNVTRLNSYKFPQKILDDKSHFSPHWNEDDDITVKELSNYVKNWGSGICMAKTQDLMRMVRNGIPLGLKTPIWHVLLGSGSTMIISDKNYYPSLVEKQRDVNAVSDEMREIINQIEKDLCRSFPELEYFSKNGEGIAPLRRVLRAYAAHNPTIGYCQSMNIVTGTLLMFVENEEEVFYMLSSLIQRVPEYYDREMLGSLVDVRIFADLLAEKMPELSAHFKKIDIDISLIVLPWFLCMYVGYVPWEVSLRIADSFFAEGSNIYLQVGLAILQLNKSELLQLTDLLSVIIYFKNVKFDCSSLCKLAFKDLHLDREKISILRNYHKFQVIQGIYQRSTDTLVSDLKKRTKFSREDINKLNERFQSYINLDSTDSCIREADFCTMFKKDVSWWPIENYELVFKLFDKQNKGMVSFREYVTNLDIILHGNLLQIQKFSFDLYADPTTKLAHPNEILKSIAIVLVLHQYRKSTSSIEDHHVVDASKILSTEPDKLIDFTTYQSISLSYLLNK